MPMALREIREQLLAGDMEYRRLAEEHSRYEMQIEQLAKASYVSAEDFLLEAKLKKMKLRVKDEMEKHVARLLKSGAIH